MEETIASVKAEFCRASQRVARALATTPDDRINWSPSPTARTPIQQVAHAAMATEVFGGILAGRPHEFKGPLLEEQLTRAAEKQYTTREAALALLERQSAEYVTWLESLTPEQISSSIETPFGTLPMASAITVLADHLRGHAAQIDYIQTIYGDHDWHLPG